MLWLAHLLLAGNDTMAEVYTLLNALQSSLGRSPHRMQAVYRCGLLLPIFCGLCMCVCVCACLLVITVSNTKTDEPTEVPFTA